jgi:hypothetical protein
VKSIWIIEDDDDTEKMSNVFREALRVETGLNMVVVTKYLKPIDE